ncbi:B12-binding domain-containing radical SAM protein [Acidobacteria bacterium AH-259-D05]|nr:B12-binding domain-containing radical SAM protein [Acidobacteria bacterium AH-259-D05]
MAIQVKDHNLGNGRRPQAFRILLVYPNIQQCALMPYSIGLFTALLKQEGFLLDLFDSTFYMNDLNQNYPFYQSALRDFDWNKRGVEFNSNDMIEDFRKKVEEFQPDLLAFSVVENTYPVGRALYRSLEKKVPALWGGVFATYAPEVIISDEVGDYICRGEGEEVIVELCHALCKGLPVENIQNLWVKRSGNLYKNPMRPPIDLNTLPVADYSLLSEQAIYRPMQGKIWRTIGIETQRGCPYTCTYCNSPSNNAIYKNEDSFRFYRKKTMEVVHKEITQLHKKHNIELIYFLVDTFLAVSTKEFDELADMYQDFRIPFWMNTRAETIDEHRAEGLERMNSLRVSIGIEHGNAEYREKMLSRKVSNERMLEAFRLLSGRSYITNGNSIIGMPDETRELVFDTIKFLRQIPEDIEQTGTFIFAPYRGTGLRKVAVRKGYLDPNIICDIQDPAASILDQPQLPRAAVLGLARTFALYTTMPESEWTEIEVAERDTEEGRQKYREYQNKYRQLNAAARLDEGIKMEGAEHLIN